MGCATDYKKAKAAENDKRVKEIDTRAKARQRWQHEQGFSTGSIANIMAKIKESLPAAARQAGVGVTDDLGALFQVSAKGLELAKGVRSQQPLPIEQITDDMD